MKIGTLKSWLNLCRSDPRHGQLFVLTSLLIYGTSALESFPPITHSIVTLVAAPITHLFFCRRVSITNDPRSAIITALSLLLLLRTSSLLYYCAALIIAIGSKFVLRTNRGHLLNPANAGLVAVSLVSNQAWIAGGQWGRSALFALILGAIGFAVVNHAKSLAVSILFATLWSSSLFARALWYGDPLSLPLHTLLNGGTILFTFYMISDPKTVPQRWLYRVIFCGVTVAIASIIEFAYYKPHGIFYALFASCVLRAVSQVILPYLRSLTHLQRSLTTKEFGLNETEL